MWWCVLSTRTLPDLPHPRPSLLCSAGMDRLTQPILTTGCSSRVSSRSCQWSSQTSTSTLEGTRSATAAGESSQGGEGEGRGWEEEEGEGEGGLRRGCEVLKFSFHPILLQVYQSCHLEVDGAAQHHWTVRSAGAVLRHTVGADSQQHSTHPVE